MRNPVTQNFQPYTPPIVQTPPPFQSPPLVPHPPSPMATRFPPLDFPIALHDLPINYSQRVTLYDGEGNFIAKYHVDRFEDFIDLEEVDYDDVNMSLFEQSLSRE